MGGDPELISIHALREEGDYDSEGMSLTEKRFLSTPSARRATTPWTRIFRPTPISIHALREEGDSSPHSGHRKRTISIHALREEGDILRP